MTKPRKTAREEHEELMAWCDSLILELEEIGRQIDEQNEKSEN